MDLTRVLSGYLESDTDLLPVKRSELEEMRKPAADLGLLEGQVEMWPDIPRPVLAMGLAETLGRPLHVDPESLELELDDSSKALARAISWAATNMGSGSLIAQNRVGQVLNSGYEDSPVSQAFSSPNEGMARLVADSIVEAGRKAGEWALQLIEE